jgi:hypothetical protein
LQFAGDAFAAAAGLALEGGGLADLAGAGFVKGLVDEATSRAAADLKRRISSVSWLKSCLRCRGFPRTIRSPSPLPVAIRQLYHKAEFDRNIRAIAPMSRYWDTGGERPGRRATVYNDGTA